MQGLALPPSLKDHSVVGIGSLGERVYLLHENNLWVMKEYGNEHSWSKLFRFEKRPSFPVIRIMENGEMGLKLEERGRSLMT
ncbi:hypothetical protein AKJ16_DCAP19095 [Drosera capensis]